MQGSRQEKIAAWAAGLGHYSGYCYYCRGAPLAEPCCAEVHARMKSLRSSVQAEYLRLQVLVLVKFGILEFFGALGLGIWPVAAGRGHDSRYCYYCRALETGTGSSLGLQARPQAVGSKRLLQHISGSIVTGPAN